MNNDNATNDKTPSSAIAAGLASVGMTWTKHGLAVGRSALEASAKSLHATADLLGHVADVLEGRHAVAPKGDAIEGQPSQA
jgi:hypothetical protein